MLYKIDKRGYLINEGTSKKIERDYSLILADLRSNVLKYFKKRLVSFYVRGSVSTGKAKWSKSDIDCVLVVKDRISLNDRKWFLETIKKLGRKYCLDQNTLDLTAVSKKEFLRLNKFIGLKINLNTASTLLYGEDILRKLPKIRVDKKLPLRLYGHTPEELNELKLIFLGKIKKEYSFMERSTKFWCVWMCRTILRSSLGLIMLKRRIYSNDLRTCAKLFLKDYPDYKRGIIRALKWSQKPSGDKDKLIKYLGTFGEQYSILWQYQRDKNKFSDFNPISYQKLKISGSYIGSFNEARKMLGNLDKKKVMDYGCGPGRSVRFLKKLGAEVSGLDISKKMLALAKRFNPGVKWILIKNKKIPCENGSFDVAFSSFVHTGIASLREMTDINRQIYEKIKPRGFLVIITVNPRMWGKEYVSCYSFFSSDFKRKGGNRVNVILKENPPIFIQDYFWEKADYIKSLKNAGFKKIQITEPKSRKEMNKPAPYLVIKAIK